MDLFDNIITYPVNLLPQDGEANYYGVVIAYEQAEYFFNALFDSIEWKQDEVIISGKRIVARRKVAWYGNKPFKYTYSNTTKTALPWTAELLQLKKVTEQKSGETYNSCLLNLYHNGREGMAWHSDNEKDLKKNAAIASLSFGAERKFSFKHKKTKNTVSLTLHNGGLLVMKGEIQTYWQHSLPPTKKTDKPRINLTFRSINNDAQS